MAQLTDLYFIIMPFCLKKGEGQEQYLNISRYAAVSSPMSNKNESI